MHKLVSNVVICNNHRNHGFEVSTASHGHIATKSFATAASPSRLQLVTAILCMCSLPLPLLQKRELSQFALPPLQPLGAALPHQLRAQSTEATEYAVQ